MVLNTHVTHQGTHEAEEYLDFEKNRTGSNPETFQDISSLKAVEREKGNLLSMSAHNMKSSLTIIGGFVLRLCRARFRRGASGTECVPPREPWRSLSSRTGG
jgi:hypothetical protein